MRTHPKAARIKPKPGVQPKAGEVGLKNNDIQDITGVWSMLPGRENGVAGAMLLS
jgi:hypothetical protein